MTRPESSPTAAGGPADAAARSAAPRPRGAGHDTRALGGCDVVVVGAGLVGLATARALAARGARVTVLEAEARVAAHQSGHNSGVVHAGLYYPPGSLKARLCREGRGRLAEFCARARVPLRVCGKLVVATDEAERARLDALAERGARNGLVGLERLDAAAVRAREPAVAGVAGLLVPETGVVDFAAVARALADDCRAAGVALRVGEAFVGLEPGPLPPGADGTAPGDANGAPVVDHGARRLRVRTTRGALEAERLVACAGLQADRVARACGVDPGAVIVPFRGEYRRLVAARAGLVRRIVYPVPDPAYPFLGVHFTRTLDDVVEIGPNAVLAGGRHAYARGERCWRDLLELARWPGTWRMFARGWRTGVGEAWRARSERAALAAMQRLVPQLRAEDVEPARAGVRAQLVRRDGALIDDFHVVGDARNLHVLNAPSPAATASLAIGERVARRVCGDERAFA